MSSSSFCPRLDCDKRTFALVVMVTTEGSRRLASDEKVVESSDGLGIASPEDCGSGFAARTGMWVRLPMRIPAASADKANAVVTGFCIGAPQ